MKSTPKYNVIGTNRSLKWNDSISKYNRRILQDFGIRILPINIITASIKVAQVPIFKSKWLSEDLVKM